MPRPVAALAAALASVAVLTACSGTPSGEQSGGTTTGATSPGTSTSGTSTSGTTSATDGPADGDAVLVADQLDVPWGLAFLPDGSALVTLRDSGEVLRVREGAAPVSVGTVPGVDPDGEGGLLGLAVSPQFASDARVFVYLTAAGDNRVLRLTLREDRLAADRVVLDGIPKASIHNGGRLAFGPDGFLYVTTGDASESARSQDRDSLAGKILRVTADGAAAFGNPFGNRVWSLGHRNVQGIAWDGDRMYAGEFGQNTWDELNLIEPGRNYGWPEVEGRAGRDGFTDPLRQWSTSDASPSGIAVSDGAVYLAALRGESLWRVPLLADGGTGEPERLLAGAYGRLRTVERAPDGRLWLVTSNTFRGTPRNGDDRIVILPGDVG